MSAGAPRAPLTGPVDALTREGLRLQEAGRHGEAATWFERALAANPRDDGVRVLYAQALLRSQRLNRARREFARLVESSPDNAWLRTCLAAALQQQDRIEDAIAQFRRATELDASLAEAHVGLGVAALRAGRPDAALAALQRACQLDPHDSVAHATAGDACRDLARYDEAIDWYRKALVLEPGMLEAATNLGQMLLLLERYAEGWDTLEGARNEAELRRRASFACPRWTGEPLEGRSIHLWFEQGLGDQVMYAGCIADLLARGARCIIECEPRLAALFTRAFTPSRVVVAGENGFPPSDFHSAAEDLPRVLRRSTELFARHAGYLQADPALRQRMRDRLDALGPGIKVGLSWRGGTARTRRAQRTIPLAALDTLAHTAGVRFVSLQYDETGSELVEPENPAALGIAHWPEVSRDLDASAALIAGLDLVISVPTTAVHLAGALGRPVWILAPFSPDFRYLAAGERMPWYPSARLIRQRSLGDWFAPLAVAGARLALLASERPAQS